MKLIITCGPSYEPIDEARRLTNFSTGKLGITLANALTAAGHEVFCLKGEQATCPDPLRVTQALGFSTNDDLASKLEALSRLHEIGAVLHAAALCDFKVGRVVTGDGRELSSKKFSTRDGELHLVLAPTLKVLPKLRGWFPRARIVGWKYGLVGTRDDACAEAWRQLRETDVDACVLNGAAYGAGFAVCQRPDRVEPRADLPALIEWFRDWLASPRLTA